MNIFQDILSQHFFMQLEKARFEISQKIINSQDG